MFNNSKEQHKSRWQQLHVAQKLSLIINFIIFFLDYHLASAFKQGTGNLQIQEFTDRKLPYLELSGSWATHLQIIGRQPQKQKQIVD